MYVVSAGIFFLYIVTSYVQCQQIYPTPLIEGRLGENVTIVCTSVIPGEALNNILSIYRPAQGVFESFEMDNRLLRANDVSNSTYTFGPLMESDNGIVFRCTSSGQSSANSTISIEGVTTTMAPTEPTTVGPTGQIENTTAGSKPVIYGVNALMTVLLMMTISLFLR